MFQVRWRPTVLCTSLIIKMKTSSRTSWTRYKIRITKISRQIQMEILQTFPPQGYAHHPLATQYFLSSWMAIKRILQDKRNVLVPNMHIASFKMHIASFKMNNNCLLLRWLAGFKEMFSHSNFCLVYLSIYCNAFYVVLSLKMPQKLQLIQNAAT